MNRKTLIAIAITAAAGASFADDITIDNTPFVSTATRAEVQADAQAFQASGVNPWSNRYDVLADFDSERSRAQVRAEYVDARDRVAAFTGEDSGSSYLAAGGNVPAPTTVAGQPRNAH